MLSECLFEPFHHVLPLKIPLSFQICRLRKIETKFGRHPRILARRRAQKIMMDITFSIFQVISRAVTTPKTRKSLFVLRAPDKCMEDAQRRTNRQENSKSARGK